MIRSTVHPRIARTLVLLVGPIMATATAGAGDTWTFEPIVSRGSAADLDEAGRILARGEVDEENPGQEAFLVTPDGRLLVLPMQDGFTRVEPVALGPGGLAVGAFLPDGVQNNQRPIAFDPESLEPVILADLPFGRATAVDEDGRIYGVASTPNQAQDYGTLAAPQGEALLPEVTASVVRGARDGELFGSVDGLAAVIDPAGTFSLLAEPESLGGIFRTVTAIDRFGDGSVLGNIDETLINGAVRRPVVWDPDGNPSVLPAFATGFSSVLAFDADESGRVVGEHVALSSGAAFATLWVDGVPIDLNAVVRDLPADFVLVRAKAINEAGEILVDVVDLDLPPGSALGVGILRPITAPCPADVDGDGVVAFGDLLAVLAVFGDEGDPGAPADVNADGIIDFDDVLAVLADFGTACG